MGNGTGPKGRTRWHLLFTSALLGTILLAACQAAAPAAPTAAPKQAAPAAPAAAPPAATSGAAVPATAQTAGGKVVTVKIGFQPAYTGPVAAQSEIQSRGMADYLQSINDDGGFAYKDPKTGETIRAKLDIMWEDSAFEAARYLSIYSRQKAAGVKAILANGSAAAAALAESASKDKMPVLASASPNATVLKPTPRYITTLGNLYDMNGKSFVKWAKGDWKESRAPRLGIVYADATFGQMATDGLVDFAKKLGWEVLPMEVIKEPLTDSTVQVKRLMGGKPDWVFAAVTAPALSVLMKDASSLGFKGQTKWVTFTYSFDTSVFQKVADAETDGAMAWLQWAVETESKLPGVAQAEAGSQKYRKAPLSNLYLQGWGTATVFVLGGLKGALEKVGYDALTPEAVNTSLHSLKGLDVGGIFAPVFTTEDAPWIASKARLVQWKDHKINVLTDWQDSSAR